jgi:hypothetical protein
MMLSRKPARVACVLMGLTVALFPRSDLDAQPRPVQAPAATISGTILDEGGNPVDGARVAVPGTSLASSSGADGAFRLAGVSPGRATVTVSKEGFSVLEFDFAIAAGVSVSLKLTLVAQPPVQSADSVASAADSVGVSASDSVVAVAPQDARKVMFRGRVIDSSGAPIFGAIVEEAASRTRTMTDSLGRFALQRLDPGLLFVRARKLGYLAEYFPVTAVAGRTVTTTIRLRPAGQQLAKVTVSERALDGDTKLRGFYERAAKGTGVFVERAEIVRRNATQLSDVLRGRNGINIYGSGASGAVIAGRGLRMAGGQGPGVCPLPLILDGVYIKLQDGLTVDRVVNVQDVRAIEVYTTGPQVPAELANGQTDCGAIVVWTR